MNYFNFTIKSDLTEQEKKLNQDLGILFMQTSEGVDFYDAMKSYTNQDSYKLCLDTTLAVCFYSKDATMLPPISSGCSVVELENIPDSLDTTGRWIYSEESSSLSKRDETTAEILQKNTNSFSDKLSEAANIITPLQYKNDLSISTETEAIYLNLLKRYVIDLYDIDLNEDNISWPDLPETT